MSSPSSKGWPLSDMSQTSGVTWGARVTWAAAVGSGVVTVSVSVGVLSTYQRWANTPATAPSMKNMTIAAIRRLRYCSRMRRTRAFMAAVCFGE